MSLLLLDWAVIRWPGARSRGTLDDPAQLSRARDSVAPGATRPGASYAAYSVDLIAEKPRQDLIKPRAGDGLRRILRVTAGCSLDHSKHSAVTEVTLANAGGGATLVRHPASRTHRHEPNRRRLRNYPGHRLK